MYASTKVNLLRSRSRSTQRWKFLELIALVLLIITAVLVRGLMENERAEVPNSEAVEGGSLEQVLSQQEIERNAHESMGNVYSSDAHRAADSGDLSMLHRIKNENSAVLHESDDNGWHPLHFAVRSGRYEAVKFLVENGADIKHRTNDGSTAMGIAKEALHPDDPIVHLLHTIDGNLFGALNGGFSGEL